MAACAKAERKYDEFHASSLEGSDGSEQGESEMMEEEGEYEWEEGESEIEYPSGEIPAPSSSEAEEGSEPPKLVPITQDAMKKKSKAKAIEESTEAKVKGRKAAAKVEQSSSSDVSDSDDWESIDSDMSSEELENREAELAQSYGNQNAHGFVFSSDLNTYRMNK